MAPPWLGWLIAASILRQAGVTTGAHLAAINLGLKTIHLNGWAALYPACKAL